ncbi:MAG: hypothetical protein KAX65_00910 [Caldilineaceae bacterium]|nr:hypothetical protein [Caldilineaceae bacterium]
MYPPRVRNRSAGGSRRTRRARAWCAAPAPGSPTLNNLACVGNIGVEGGAMTLVERRMHAGNWQLS